VRLHQQRVGDRLLIANESQGASILDAAEPNIITCRVS
jgi:hypothetical protein